MSNENIKKIIVVTTGSFPYGGSVANRHISYLKGFVKLGISVKVFLTHRAIEQSPLSNSSEGIFEGIKYKYATWNYLKRGFSIKKIIIKLRSIFIINFLVRKEIHGEGSNTIILFLLVDPFALWMIRSVLHRRNISLFHERMEYPYVHTRKWYKQIWTILYLKQLKKLDGLFVITNALKDYYEKFIDINKIVHIPMTVEPERFQVNKTPSLYGNYIAYCGTMYTDKDGLPILVKAFDIFALDCENVNLVLIGDNSRVNELNDLLRVVKESKNRDRIIFTGRLDRDDIPQLLINASVLALARPDNEQAKGGFPTKLGEYLATGNPVIVTKVGEIPFYLGHKKNAYLAEPNNPKDFAEKLKNIFNDYEKAKYIGFQGKKLALSVFNYKTQTTNLLNFFDTQIGAKKID